MYKNAQSIRRTGYGCEQPLTFLEKKYRLIDGFGLYQITTEWELLRPSLISYVASAGKQYSSKLFWKEFILLQQAISFSFTDDYKNILLLVQVYLALPINSSECEHGYSVSNHTQSNGRSRFMVDTKYFTDYSSFTDDIRRYEQEYERKFASVI